VSRDLSGDGTYDERLYVQQDANYNPASLSDNTGVVVERFLFDPYGVATFLDPNWSVDAAGSDYAWTHLHQGGRHDPLTGLVHFRFRDYRPTLGRWTQQDPAGYVDGANLYLALLSNPVHHNDPTGLAVPLGLMLLGWAAGAAAGGVIGGAAWDELKHQLGLSPHQAAPVGPMMPPLPPPAVGQAKPEVGAKAGDAAPGQHRPGVIVLPNDRDDRYRSPHHPKYGPRDRWPKSTWVGYDVPDNGPACTWFWFEDDSILMDFGGLTSPELHLLGANKQGRQGTLDKMNSVTKEWDLLPENK
jgi:RHS repeat-associated protein